MKKNEKREREKICVCVRACVSECVYERERKDDKRKERKKIDAESDKSRRIGTQKNTYTLGYKSLNFNEATLKNEKP